MASQPRLHGTMGSWSVFVFSAFLTGTLLPEIRADIILPDIDCPQSSILTTASIQPDGVSLAANLTCYVYSNVQPPSPAPGPCVIIATDNVNVTSATPTGDYLLNPGVNSVSFIAYDAAGNSRSCSVTVVVATISPAHDDILNFMNSRALSSSEVDLVGVDTQTFTTYATNVRAAANFLDQVGTSQPFEDIIVAILRLTQHIPSSGIAINVRGDLLAAARKIGELRQIRRATEVPVDVSRSCGNGQCEITLGESCSNCPSDCSSATIHAISGAADEPCVMEASVRIRSDRYEFGIGQRFDRILSLSPLKTNSIWDSLPAGFGVVGILLDVDRSNSGSGSTDIDYRVQIDGLSKSDVQQGSLSQFVDPSANDAVAGHSFAGVTFSVTFRITQSGSPTPAMRIILDLSAWGRKIDGNSPMSLFRFDGVSWSQCSGRLGLDAESLVYNTSMIGCFANMGNSARQFALFIDNTIVPFTNVEFAFASIVNNLMAYSPPEEFYGNELVNSLQEEANFLVIVQASFPMMVSLLALDDTATAPVFTTYRTNFMNIIVDKVPFIELGTNQYSLQRLGSNTSATVVLPAISSFGPVERSMTITDPNQQVIFAMIYHENVHRDPSSTTEVHSMHAIELLFQNGLNGSFFNSSAAATTSDILVTFTELSISDYSQYDTPETYRRCSVLEVNSSDPNPSESLEWLEGTTLLAEPDGLDTTCQTNRFAELGWYFPVTTSTTTTISSTTYHPRLFISDSLTEPATVKNSDWTIYVIAIVILGFILCSMLEACRYRSKVVSYEAKVGTSKINSLPMAVDYDLMSRPFENCIDFTVIGRHLSCLHWCYRSIHRHSIVGMLCAYNALCFVTVYPLRPSILLYLTTTLSIAVGSCALLGYERDQDKNWFGDALPRDWIYDTTIPGYWMPVNNTHFVQIGQNSYLKIAPGTIRTTSSLHPIYTDAVVDGIWTAIFALPVLFIVSFSLGKYHGYLNVLRVLSPPRFRATYRSARAQMEKRGLPVGFWIRRAQGKSGVVVVENDAIIVEPGVQAMPLENIVDIQGELKYRSDKEAKEQEIIESSLGDKNKVKFDPSAPKGAFFDQGYLEMEPDTIDILDGKIPRESVGMGWGTDSILGDDHAVSGANLAVEEDNDSLMDYVTEANYEEGFTVEMEVLVQRAHSWRAAVFLVTFLAVIYAVVCSYLYLGENDNRSDASQSIFIGGVVTYGIITFVIYAPALLLFTVLRRSCCRKEPVEGESAVGVPDCCTVIEDNMVC